MTGTPADVGPPGASASAAFAAEARVVASWVAAGFLLGAVVFSALAATWAVELRQPRVVLLGSGERLSLLVTDGAARLLIATGNDPVAFGNALARVRRAGQPRLDVLLVTGSGPDLLAPAAIAADPHVRVATGLVPFPRSADMPSLAPLAVLDTPSQIRLGTVSVLLETAPVPDAPDNPEQRVWRATIERGPMRIVVLSDGDAASSFPPAPDADALVVVGNDALTGWTAQPVPALAAADSHLPPGRDLRAEAGRDALGPAYVVRVFPGEAVPLTFGERGLELPRGATLALRATPAGG